MLSIFLFLMFRIVKITTGKSFKSWYEIKLIDGGCGNELNENRIVDFSFFEVRSTAKFLMKAELLLEILYHLCTCDYGIGTRRDFSKDLFTRCSLETR